MIIYTIANLLTGFIEALMMFMLCEAFFKRKPGMPLWAYVLGVLAITVIIDTSNIVFSYSILNGAIMICAFFALTFLYVTKPAIGIIIAVLNNAIAVTFEMVTMYTIILVFNITVTEAIDIPEYKLLGIILSKMLALIATNILRLKYKNRTVHNSASYWLMFFLTFVTSAATVLLIFELTYRTEKAKMYNFSVICSYGLLFSAFFVLYLYEHLSKQEETIRVQQQYEQNLKMELRHFDEMAVAQRQLKKFKHDFKNYVIGLGAYIDQNNVPGASEYLDSMKEKFAPGNTIIETGNPALDAMLSTKKAVADSKNIDFNTRIQIPENLNINSADLCVIFGNALDNAIEACERTKRADAVIDLDITYNANVLYCKIINTSLLPEENKRKTAKTDKFNHGFGLENIKTALSKYHSEPAITHIGDTFTLSFIVFI